MDSDQPDTNTISPQDSSRFSKSKSAPPILDLEAEHATSSAPDEPASTSTFGTQQAQQDTMHETLHISAPSSRFFSIRTFATGLIGGVIGGSLVMIAALVYFNVMAPPSPVIASLQKALAGKADQTSLNQTEQRMKAVDASIGALQSAIAAATKTPAPIDPDLLTRIERLENDVQSRIAPSAPSASATAPQGNATSADHRALRLVLMLSLRDAIRNGTSSEKSLAALDKAGEASPAFSELKAALATPLMSYAMMRNEMSRLVKARPIAEPSKPDIENQDAPIASWLNRFVTIRPASSPTREIAMPAATFAPLRDALDQSDPQAALNALAALPQPDAENLKPLRDELERRVKVDHALSQLLDDSLDGIAKGITP